MMYTFGDARDTNEEAAELVESIVRTYTAELLRRANANAFRRSTRMTMDDIIFQIRRDTPKLNRLKEFLSWREIRKGLKTQTEKPTDDPSAAVEAKGTLCMLLTVTRLQAWRCSSSAHIGGRFACRGIISPPLSHVRSGVVMTS